MLVDDGLSFLAHDVRDEVLGEVALSIRLERDIERTGNLVCAVGHVFGSRLNVFDLDRLHLLIQRTEGHIADRLLIAFHGHQHRGRVVGDLRILGGHIHLFAVDLLLNAGQLNERAACTGTLFTGNDGNRLVRLEFGAKPQKPCRTAPARRRSRFWQTFSLFFSSFYVLM